MRAGGRERDRKVLSTNKVTACVCVCVRLKNNMQCVFEQLYICKCVCAHACMCLFVPIVLTQVLPLTTEWSQQSPESNKGACLNTNQISRGT